MENIKRTLSEPINEAVKGQMLSDEDLYFLKEKYENNSIILQIIENLISRDSSFHFYFNKHYAEEALQYCVNFIRKYPPINSRPLKITFVGPPCSGKSELVKWLTQTLYNDYILIDVDYIVNTFKDSKRVKLIYETYNILRRFSGLIAELLEIYYLQNNSIIVTPKTISNFDWYKTTIEFPEIIICVDADDNTLIKNKHKRDTNGSQDFLDPEKFEKLKISSRLSIEKIKEFRHPLIEVISIFIDSSYNYSFG